MLRRTLAPSLMVALLVSCSSSDAPPAPPPGPGITPVPAKASELVPPKLSPTSALIERAELATLVDALAGQRRVESSHIGAAGSPSPVWAKWDAVQRAASADELRALLRHQSPAVRGYVAQHLVRTQTPLEVEPLRPLLADASTVATTEGCMIGNTTIASLVVDELCYNAKDKETARKLLRDAADHGSVAAEQAARCLPKG